jgi:Resolvase, N terminal domain
VYSDKLSGTSTRQQRPGLAALLDYAREGDAIVVVGIDRLGRNAAVVMTTIRELGERGIVLRSLREGIGTFNATGGRCPRQPGRVGVGAGQRTPHGIAGCTAGTRAVHGRPKALDQSRVALAQRIESPGNVGGSIRTRRFRTYHREITNSVKFGKHQPLRVHLRRNQIDP